jgi:predicted site-specific integrase-resolvase
MPPVAEELVLIVPAFPAFSPAAIAELLSINRCTVHYWLEQGKLPAFRDNIGERYVLREVLVRFVREYLGRVVHD